MKNLKSKISLLTLVILVTTFLAACSNPKFTVDVSNMPATQRQNHEKILKDGLAEYDKAKTDADKQAANTKIGFEYMVLGQYDKSIPYYKEVLKTDPTNFQALNNLAVMYEEAGEIKIALEFEQKLYQAYSINVEVISDLIRLLVKYGQIDDAQGVLEKFAKNDDGSNAAFISDQFMFIQNARNPKKPGK